MEAFESFVAVALETEGLVVSEAIKFRVALPTKKAAYAPGKSFSDPPANVTGATRTEPL